VCLGGGPSPGLVVLASLIPPRMPGGASLGLSSLEAVASPLPGGLRICIFYTEFSMYPLSAVM